WKPPSTSSTSRPTATWPASSPRAGRRRASSATRRGSATSASTWASRHRWRTSPSRAGRRASSAISTLRGATRSTSTRRRRSSSNAGRPPGAASFSGPQGRHGPRPTTSLVRPGTRLTSRSGLTRVLAGVLLIAVAALSVPAVRHLREQPPPPPPTLRFSLPPPEGAELGSGDDTLDAAITADGQHLAFVATRDGTPALWHRRLAEPTA